MEYQHKNLASGHWQELSFFEQVANIGSEIERTIKWKNKGNTQYSSLAFERGLELLDFTIEDKKNKSRLRELLRVREALVDHFVFENEYGSTDKNWQNYFFAFNFAVRAHL